MFFCRDLKNLKDLILSNSSYLESMPYFREHMIIERLVLKKCCLLKNICDYIGNLKCLKHLELCDESVVSLPESKKTFQVMIIQVNFSSLSHIESRFVIILSERYSATSAQFIILNYSAC
ncbi:hypothetical protein SAY86_028377 [Trapa natans]|uniref:Uncharacterized protein n=1 Tax=Trapa natans TaxID=22666 RepID=A0AAN7RDZ6_TRANT|nr:hypothetical protein SAY86_028377 [Trapa natans]